jgi:hypothetical protein
MERTLLLLSVAMLGGCHFGGTLAGGLSSRKAQVQRLGPALVDEQASTVSIEAPHYQSMKPGGSLEDLTSAEIRAQLASALTNLLSDTEIGQATRPARFRLKLSGREGWTPWTVLQTIPPFAYPMLGMLWLENANVICDADLSLQIGDELFEGKGHGEVYCSRTFSLASDCFQESAGEAIGEALASLGAPRRVAAGSAQ